MSCTNFRSCLSNIQRFTAKAINIETVPRFQKILNSISIVQNLSFRIISIHGSVSLYLPLFFTILSFLLAHNFSCGHDDRRLAQDKIMLAAKRTRETSSIVSRSVISRQRDVHQFPLFTPSVRFWD
jgi:hypothetical protein